MMRSCLPLLAAVLAVMTAQKTEAASQTVSDGTYRIASKYSGKLVDVKDSATGNSALVVQYAYSSSRTSQEWAVKHIGSGYYRLVNSHSSRAMDVSGKSTADGGSVIQYAYSGEANQLWEIRKHTSGYYAIINKNSGKALDVWGWSSSNNGVLDQYTYWSGDCQLWEMKLVSSTTTTTTTTTPTPPTTTTTTTTTPTPATSSSSSTSTGTATGYATGTTGGTGGTTVTVTTCSAFLSAVTGDSKKIVQLTNGAIDCRTSNVNQAACLISCDDGSDWYRVPTSTQSCTSLGSKTSSTYSRTRNERSVTIGSYTTVIGLGSKSALYGVSLDLSGKKQIILKNFHLTEINPALVEAGDGVSLDSSSYIWIDHMKFSRISDGYFDMYDSTYVTISYTYIDGYNTDTCRDQHWYVCLVDNSQVTFHHNYWYKPAGRNPKILGSSARVHSYNNYYKSVYYFCLSSTDSAYALVQNNYYEDSRYPHWVDGGYISASGNTYTGASTTSGVGRSTSGSAFTPGYTYTLATASTLPSTIPSAAGPQ